MHGFPRRKNVAAKKNSLVENINRRKRAGKSRPRSASTISSEAYQDMQAGWPRRKAAKRKAAGKKSQRTAGKTRSKRRPSKR
jgi:hypothetical protein